ncbi:unnamed protein product [Closterium sp. NIES-53]
MTTLRVLLHVAAQRDYELHSLDFSTAFLQGSLHEEIRLRRPPGFTGTFPVGTQWSLRRPVYGLRQAPRKWHDTLRTTIVALGFAPSTADPLLFLRTDTSLPPFYVLVYVDDLVFATANTEALTLVKSELQKRHTCTDLGELRSYLGLQITRDRARRTITLTQSHMVHQSVEPSGPYPELVGCLMYLITCTRPDLAYPLSLLARYVAPGRHRKVHSNAGKRVMRYLCGTSGMGLVLGGRGLVVLIGHADASWVDDSATQRPSQGYTFSLGSGSVSWRSTRTSSVLCSSCGAEIYARAMAAQELHWLTYLLIDLGEQSRSPPVLYVDNKAMIALCQEHRTKHIALRYFLARELQQRGQLRLAYVATWANTADVFTKALLPSDHQRFVTVLPCFASSLDWSCDHCLLLEDFLVSTLVLRIANQSKPFKAITDASDFAFGAVLLQDFGNGLQPIAFESRKLHAAKHNNSIYEKEMLVIIHEFKQWRCYLTRADITIRTDHKSLQYLRSQPYLNPQKNWSPTPSPGREFNRCSITQTFELAPFGLFTYGYTMALFFTTSIQQPATTRKTELTGFGRIKYCTINIIGLAPHLTCSVFCLHPKCASRERGCAAAVAAAETHPPPLHPPPTAAGAAVREEEAWRQLLLLKHIRHPLTPSPPTAAGAAVREEERGGSCCC